MTNLFDCSGDYNTVLFGLFSCDSAKQVTTENV